jgi:hypothetical protein
MTNKTCNHESFEGAIQFDQLDGAIIGYGYQFNNPVVFYDYGMCVDIFELDFQEACELHRDECREACDHYLEAIEWMDHNVTGAWVGASTPVFLHHRCDEKIDAVTPLGFVSDL